MSDLCKSVNNFGKGIANPSRYQIIKVLFSGPKTVTQISRKTKQSQPLVSQHLKALKQFGLVEDKRKGKEIFYSLNVEHVVNLLKSLLEELNFQKIKNKK
jgi:DNA-binding transcriptional ArsR family regulator